jgi:hypothetical protein
MMEAHGCLVERLSMSVRLNRENTEETSSENEQNTTLERLRLYHSTPPGDQSAVGAPDKARRVVAGARQRR